MSDQLLNQQDLQDLLRLPSNRRFAHLMALNANKAYANRLNVVELMAWLADLEEQAAKVATQRSGSSARMPASSTEIG